MDNTFENEYKRCKRQVDDGCLSPELAGLLLEAYGRGREDAGDCVAYLEKCAEIDPNREKTKATFRQARPAGLAV